MTKESFDVAVIGAGPGGYVAAIRLAQRGKKVALIDRGMIGGTCLNVGCIPTKALLKHAVLWEKLAHAHEFGIEIGEKKFHYNKMKERKDRVVAQLVRSLTGLLTANGITLMKGTAEFSSPTELKVRGQDNRIALFSQAIIATGSAPMRLPFIPQSPLIYDSTSILDITTLPKKLAILGGGYIGCEFASLFAAFGVEVTIIEMLPEIISLQGKDLSSALTKSFERRKVRLLCNVKANAVRAESTSVKISLSSGQEESFDALLVSVGRQPVTDGLNLNAAGVALDPRGYIPVNERMETSVPGIYAIGDVTGRLLLAHVASHQGLVAASRILGEETEMHYDAVPAVIFTDPEIASVGLTPEDAKAVGREVKVTRYPFMALGKATATGEIEGFVQILSEPKTTAIVGAQVIGDGAASLIAEMTLAIANELTLDAVSETIHAHPTFPEAWMEASLLAQGTPLHFPPVKK